MEEKCDSVGEEEDPLREIGKLALVSGNLEIGELGKPSPENPKILPDSDCLNAGEAPIDHDEAQAVPRAISRVHSGPHRGVQGREPPPAAPWPPLPPDPDRPWLTGLGPVRFFAGPARKFGPFRPNAPVQSNALPGGFSFERASPILSDPIVRPFFFLFTEKPLNFPD
ncbi:hypothetical protein CDL15_Pgr004496 [Punica granatum]|uniref:Uncharacterized protein n=1 Tax=Punica granatum TaxID=22663 RepID=A0A218X0E3_PUNGR|nr:hypothetical protein CDL15_Pgr004496 [Punica granatum]